MLGYKYSDIAEIFSKKYNHEFGINRIKYMQKKICEKILYEYKYSFNNWLQLSEHIKLKSNEKYKQCKLCKKYLPIKNFRKYKRSPDGLFYYCPVCDTYTRHTSRM
jgi:hypothetical protein